MWELKSRARGTGNLSTLQGLATQNKNAYLPLFCKNFTRVLLGSQSEGTNENVSQFHLHVLAELGFSSGTPFMLGDDGDFKSFPKV